MKWGSSAWPNWRRQVGTTSVRLFVFVTVHRGHADDGPEGVTDFTLLDTGSAQFLPSSKDVKLTVITEAGVLYATLESFALGIDFGVARPSDSTIRHRLYTRV